MAASMRTSARDAHGQYRASSCTRSQADSDAFASYLYWSGLLHEVGLSVSHTGCHKHAAYMVENADLPGFTTREQRLMST